MCVCVFDTTPVGQQRNKNGITSISARVSLRKCPCKGRADY